MDKFNIALLQAKAEKTKQENFDKTVGLILDASKNGADVVCTQELFLTEYFCQVEDWNYFSYAEHINEDNTVVKELSKLAKSENIVIVASLFEKRADGIYHNTAVVLDADGKFLGKYRKMHIPDDPHFYEKFYFTEGDLGYKVFNTKFAKIGTLICWDQWFPEPARLVALKGAEIIVYPTAIGWLPSEKEQFGKSQYNAWETIQRGHSVANGCFVAAINRVGFEPSPDGNEGIEFWGQSFVSNTYGEIIAKSPSDKEDVLIVEIDKSQINDTRITWPFFRDRRISSYKDLQKRWID